MSNLPKVNKKAYKVNKESEPCNGRDAEGAPWSTHTQQCSDRC